MSNRHVDRPVLVTGGAGFAGRHLAHCLVTAGHTVHLLDKSGSKPPELDGFGSRVIPHRVDLTAPRGLAHLLETIHPAEIYHLAGIANVKHSWEGEGLTYQVNVIGAVNLLSAIRHTGLSIDVLIVGSGEVYGPVPEECQPITETQSPDPRSPYAASKLCQEIAARQFAGHLEGKLVFVRPFNHIGPYQQPGFVTSDFARQVARIERQDQPPLIRVGNLSAERDFTDVRDVAKGYVAALKCGRHLDTYNICSGSTLRIQDILDRFLSESSMEIDVRVDPAKFRPADVPRLCGSSEKLRTHAGWEPKSDIHLTLREILEYWRQHPGE